MAFSPAGNRAPARRRLCGPGPMGDGVQAAGAAKHGPNRQAQHRSQRVPPTLTAPVVRHSIQSLSQPHHPHLPTALPLLYDSIRRMKRPWTGRRGRRGGARHGNCSADPAVHKGAGASPAIPEGQCWTPHPVRSSPTHGSGALCKAGRYCRELAESRVFVFRIHGRPSSLAARLPADHAEPRDAVGADAGAFRWFQAPTSLE